MPEPQANRPLMPGYGVLPPSEGTGLLPWSWAEERLAASRNFWVVTLWPDGRPHAMPVWGAWDRERKVFWFSSSAQSRKARNIGGDPRCVITSEDASNPVVIEGAAEIVTARAEISRMLDLINEKYSTDYDLEFMDPAANAAISVRPRWAFGLTEDDFSGSPTRWTFDQAVK